MANARNDVGLEDFLGIDTESRRMVHFHVHYRIPGGERHNKRFRLPWERTVLETRVRDESGVWVTAPALEVVLLMTRYALKLRGRDIAHGAHGPHAELEFLMERTTRAEVLGFVEQLLGATGAEAIGRCLDHRMDTASLYRLRRVVLRELSSQTSSRGPAAFTRRMNREAAWAMRGISRKVRPRPVLKGRGGTGGGLLVAFVGCDGSGKSTMVGETRAFLAPKLDVFPMYLGSGDGSSSLLRKPMKLVRDRLFGPARDRDTIAKKADVADAHPGAMSVAKAIWAVTLAAEKRHKIRQAMQARTRGMVVICDRWPQLQYPGELDGPRLTHWADGSAWQRRLARYELAPYELGAPVPAGPRHPPGRGPRHRGGAPARGRTRLPRPADRPRPIAGLPGLAVRCRRRGRDPGAGQGAQRDPAARSGPGSEAWASSSSVAASRDRGSPRWRGRSWRDCASRVSRPPT